MELIERNSQFSGWHEDSWRDFIRRQGIIYPDLLLLQNSLDDLRALPALVSNQENKCLLQSLRRSQNLSRQGQRSETFYLHIGDCAEVFSEIEKTFILEKLRFYRQLADCLGTALNKEVKIISRLAGQFAKPRSQAWETYSERAVLSYRGDMIHEQPLGRTHGRIPDPRRMLRAYQESAKILSWLQPTKPEAAADPEFYTSHEALHLEYESALTRRDGDEFWGSSAHFLWLGERTRFADSAHVEYLRGISNPIGVKIGPHFDAKDLGIVLKKLGAQRNEEPVRKRPVVIIPRFGIKHVTEELGRLIRLVKDQDLDVLWFLDPMHGNTLTAPCGKKTRRIQDICEELIFAIQILHQAGIEVLGLHLEASFERVTECVGGMAGVNFSDLGKNYKSAVDPRLNFSQSFEVVLTAGEVLRSYETSSSGFKGVAFDSDTASFLLRS